jgi:zinc transporter ZupT
MDGASIAAAALISWRVGVVVAVAIIVHDITDGLNTILLVTRGGSPEKKDFAFLAADALAPIAGGTLVIVSAMSTHHLALVLGVTSGFFLFTGSSCSRVISCPALIAVRLDSACQPQLPAASF